MSQELDVKHINGQRALPKGSKPPALAHQYLKEDGSDYDMSVGVWNGQARSEQLHASSQPASIGTGPVSVNALNGTATYQWVDEDFTTVGRFRIIIWVGNGGSERLGSTVYEYDVVDAPGADPTV